MIRSGAISPALLGWLCFAVLAGHAALIFLAIFFRRQVNVLYLLCGAFVVLAPLSVFSELPGSYLLKWLRVYVVALMAIIGLPVLRHRRLGLASTFLVIFIALYLLGSLWSDAVVRGLAYKGLFAVTALAGIQLGLSARDRSELIRNVRWLGVVAGIAALLTTIVILRDPNALGFDSRLALFGNTANVLGLTAVPLLVLSTFLALYDPSPRWKVLGYGAGLLLALVILFTGSRGAFAAGVVGCFLMFLPLVKHPVKTFLVVSVLALIWWAIIANVEIAALDRIIATFTKSEGIRGVADTRLRLWQEALESFSRSPVLGQGWIHTGGAEPASRNLHNVFIQVLAEGGILGILVFGVAILVAGVRGVKLFLAVRNHPVMFPLAGLPLALLGSILLHGLGESGTLAGSTLNALMWGYSVGMIDALSALAWHGRHAVPGRVRVIAIPANSRWNRGSTGPEPTT